MNKIAIEYLSNHPTAAANILQQFDLEQIIKFFGTINNETIIINCLTKFAPSIAAACLHRLPQSMMIRYFTESNLDVCIPVFQQFTPKQQAIIAPLLPKLKLHLLRYQLEYSYDSIGNIMNPKECVFNSEQSVKDVIQIIKTHVSNVLPILFIEDENQQLIGSVTLEQIAIASSNMLLNTLINKNIVRYALHVTEKLIDSLHNPHWNHYDILPVLDNRHNFVGYLTFKRLYQAITRLDSFKQPMNLLDDIISLVAYYSEMDLD